VTEVVAFYELCTVRFYPRRRINTADFERLVVIIGKYEAKMNAKIHVWLEEMMVWGKETTASREETEASLEKAMDNPDKTKAFLEQMKARKHAFEEKLDKMDAAGKACLRRSRPI
jgi:hypothetical protein